MTKTRCQILEDDVIYTIYLWWLAQQHKELSKKTDEARICINWTDVLLWQVENSFSSSSSLGTLQKEIAVTAKNWKEYAPHAKYVLFYGIDVSSKMLMFHGILSLETNDSVATTRNGYNKPLFSKLRLANTVTLPRSVMHVSTNGCNPVFFGYCYPLISNFAAMKKNSVHLWHALGCLDLNPMSAGEQFWIKRVKMCIRCLVGIIFKRTGVAILDKIASSSVSPASQSVIQDIAEFGNEACSIVRQHYFSSDNAQMAVTFDDYGETATSEFKARMYLFLWIRSINSNSIRYILSRAECLLLYAFITVGWSSEHAVCNLIEQAELPISSFRDLTAEDIGSGAGDWWKTEVCSNLNWLTVGTTQHQSPPPLVDCAVVRLQVSKPVPTHRKTLYVLDNDEDSIDVGNAVANTAVHIFKTSIHCIGGGDTAESPLDSLYLQAAKGTVTTFCVTNNVVLSNFGSDLKRAKHAFLLQPHNTCLVYGGGGIHIRNSFHVLPANNANKLVQSSIGGGQVLVSDIPVLPIFMLKCSDTTTANTVLVHCSQLIDSLAADLYEAMLDEYPHTQQTISCKDIINNILLIPMNRPPSSWIVVITNITFSTANAWLCIIKMLSLYALTDVSSSTRTRVCASSPDSYQQCISVPWSVIIGNDNKTVSFTVFASAKEGTIWPLSIDVARLHPPPSATCNSDILCFFDVQHYVNNPRGIIGSIYNTSSYSFQHTSAVLPASVTRTNDNAKVSAVGTNHEMTFETSNCNGASVTRTDDNAKVSAVGTNHEMIFETSNCNGASTWQYKLSHLRLAVTERLYLFHTNGECKLHTLPRKVFLVDNQPFLEANESRCSSSAAAAAAGKLTFELPFHRILLYTDIATWCSVMHKLFSMKADTNNHGNGPTNDNRVTSDITMRRVTIATNDIFRSILAFVHTTMEETHRQHRLTQPALVLPNASSSSMTSLYHGMEELVMSCAFIFFSNIIGEIPRSYKNGTNLRFFHNDALSIDIDGQYKGRWKNYRTGVYGTGSISLVRYLKFDDLPYAEGYSSAYKYICDNLQVLSNASITSDVLDVATMSRLQCIYKAGGDSILLTDVDVDRIDQSCRCVAVNTPVMDYLQYKRGLDHIPERLLEFWKSTRAMMSMAYTRYYTNYQNKNEHIICSAMLLWLHNQSGDRCKLQFTYLQRSNEKEPYNKIHLKREEDGDETLPAKKIRVHQRDNNSFVYIQQASDPSAPALLAEGLETGLSVAVAFPGVHVFVSCGVHNMHYFDRTRQLPQSTTVILCRDNDKGKTRQNIDSAVAKAKQEISQRGYKVYEIFPTPGFKDFNDIHQAHSGMAGTKLIENMICVQLPLMQEFRISTIDNKN